MNKHALIIGGGIGGVQAGLDLARMGIRITLVEEEPNIGGRMAQLDKTFPTNDCSTCILSPKLVEIASHPNVDIFPCSTVAKVVKNNGGFRARITKRAGFVDEQKCTACGLCAAKCPIKIPDRFNKGINHTKCIGIPYPQAVPAVFRINPEHCLRFTKGKCGACQKNCPAGAIDYEQKDQTLELDFDSVIVATGAREYTPQVRPEYGYKLHANVMTSIEFERILSASGPTGGHIKRPSDGKEPGKIAFIQCVGSRDVASGERGYCSSYCCMQATKDAIIAKEHSGHIEAAIFYIDLRTFGKDFDKFVDRARNEHKVRYIKSRISEIAEAPGTKNLVINYMAPDGKVKAEEFDLVVLSVGIGISPQQREMLMGLGIALNEFNFCKTDTFKPVSTNVSGLYICGTAGGPMDIPETVVSASAAAALAARGMLSPDIGSETKIDLPAEMDSEGQPLNIGVIVCRCGINIGAVVDVPAVVALARSIPNVTYAAEMTYACSQDSINMIIAWIKEHNLTRVIVASCSPRTHEPLFRTALEKAGLNKYLLQMTNIRDQCSWVHQNDKERATEKAKDLVSMAIGKAKYLQPLRESDSNVNKACLVIGGGISGMKAALAVAGNGFKVCLLERERELGGNLREIKSTLAGDDVGQILAATIKEVKAHSLIEIFTDARIEQIKGYVGAFSTTFTCNCEKKAIEHGAVIVATGGREHATTSYGYQNGLYVVTQRQFETILSSHNPVLKNIDRIAMIQCVDSREGDRNYCSRVCCGEAVKNALRFKRDYPGKEAYIFYRDVRTYGLLERYYTRARSAGIIFIRYDEDHKPAVRQDESGEFTIEYFDEITRKKTVVDAQIIVLSVGIDPLETNPEVARMLKVPLNADGFFQEVHVKLRPVDFATDGVFVCGLAHGPKNISESIVQAQAAAARALTVLTRDKIKSEAFTAFVNESRCAGCGLCVDVCNYGAIEIDELKNVARINALLCKGCGTCAATCFSGAIDLSGFTNKQIIKEYEPLLHG
jgi:heterodisulfide reductase subunit A